MNAADKKRYELEILEAEEIIRFFNYEQTSIANVEELSDSMIDIALGALCRADWNVIKLKKYIKDYVKYNPDKNLKSCLSGYEKDVMLTDKGKSITGTEINDSLGLLEQAVVSLVTKNSTERIETEIMGNVEQTIRDFITKEYGTIERKVTTVVDNKKVEMKGVQHEKFETVLKFVSNDEPVFLVGPAGSGKNFLCKQVAEALGLKFYFTNAVTQEYKLTGFTDANGHYQPTQFYKAFTEGGIFMLDEIDASIPEVLVILNAAIANRYFDFPAPIGYKEAHPDFRVIAAGNTVGQGASCEYVGRNQLDAASLDRFALVEIEYSKTIEDNVALGNIKLADFCRDYRKAAIKSGQQVIVSYRAIERLAKMVQIMDLEEALKTCLTKGIEKDDLNIIAQGIQGNNKYKQALKSLVTHMTA